jgi:hypothetical protein
VLPHVAQAIAASWAAEQSRQTDGISAAAPTEHVRMAVERVGDESDSRAVTGIETWWQVGFHPNHRDRHAAGQSHAAPRTPEESPCWFFRIGVVITSLNTWRGSSLGRSV